MNNQEFLTDADQTGRQIITSLKTGKKYFIEPIDPENKISFGDINPATKKVEGSYGDKYKGSVKESESLITEDNNFTNIQYCGVGVSPYAYIEQLEKNVN